MAASMGSDFKTRRVANSLRSGEGDKDSDNGWLMLASLELVGVPSVDAVVVALGVEVVAAPVFAVLVEKDDDDD